MIRFPVLVLLASLASALADVKLPSILSDHAVLQSGVTVPVWGRANAGEEITVAFAGQTKKVAAGSDGKWMVKLDPLTTSAESRDLTVSGKNTITVQDVLVGEVWLGSGQSNMAFTVGQAANAAEAAAAANHPEIRMFTVTSKSAQAPQEDCPGSWVVCSPQTVSAFSAVAYFFGLELFETLKVPVGLINSSVGGTPIEQWISLDAQKKSPELAEYVEQATARTTPASPAPQDPAAPAEAEGASATPAAGSAPAKVLSRPAVLYNGKIAPLTPFAIKGVVWYQGEANTLPIKAHLYQYQLPLLIADWRARWGYEFPFAWVQLPGMDMPPRDWPPVREAMLKTLSVKNTGMATTMDVGEPKNIHPKRKQEVGHRLALWALGTVYGKPVDSISGPLPSGSEVRGSEMVVTFKHADKGLHAKDGDLRGFEVAGADKQWKPASAKIEGDKIIVSSPEVLPPVAVRYAWANNPECNLFNGAGLPASPFRTDDW